MLLKSRNNTQVLIEHDHDIEELYGSNTIDSINQSNGKTKDKIIEDADVSAKRKIDLETNAFTGHTSSDFSFVEYVHGFVENRSEEPDSRFDRKTKGSLSKQSASIGKINIEGAAGQALEGFTGGKDDGFDRPLVAVGTNGRIKLESLSWFGAISRRYGVKDKMEDLGRQAKAGKAESLQQ